MERKKVKQYIITIAALLVVYWLFYNGLSISEKAFDYAKYLWVVFIASPIAILVFHKSWRAKFINSFGLVALLGFGVQVLAEQLLGSFHYDEMLGLRLFDTPIIIGLNWAIITYCALNITAPIKKDNSTRYLATAVLMVGVDIFLEPFAVRYNLWHWGAESAPFYNFILWFGVSLVFAVIMGPNIKRANPMAMIIYVLQILFYSFCQK